MASAVPPHRFEQPELKRLAPRLFGRKLPGIAFLFMDNAGVRSRYLAVPPDALADGMTVGERSDLYVERALELSEEAALRALEGAGLAPGDVDRIVVTSTTGEPTPSLDTRLQLALGMPTEHARPRPARGHGCAGGAEELGEAADWARAHPGGVVLVVAVELCSLTFQRDDVSRTNLAAAALFGDGAAAAVLSTEGDGGPEVLGADCVIWPGTETVMGWRQSEKGVSLVLDKGVPDLVRRRFRASLESGKEHLGLGDEELRHHVAHPGGARILDAMEDALGLGRGGLVCSRDVLRDYGNLSSATVLFVLKRWLERGEYVPGELGVVSAMGPGFRAEHVFFRA